MNNPYYHWVLPNYLVDYNNRYNDYLRYNYENASANSNSVNNYSPVGQTAAAQQATFQPVQQNQQQIWKNYYQQQSQLPPQQPQQNNRQISIENFQTNPKSSSYMPITVQLPKLNDPSTPLTTSNNPQQQQQSTRQCIQISSSKSTTDDPLNILKPDNYYRSAQAPKSASYFDPYIYSHQIQQNQQQLPNQHYFQNNKNANLQSTEQQKNNKLLNNDIINEYYDDHFNNEVNYYTNNHQYYHQNENVYSTNSNPNNNYAIFNNINSAKTNTHTNSGSYNSKNNTINKKQLQSQHQQQQNNHYSSNTQQQVQVINQQQTQSSQIQTQQSQKQIIVKTQTITNIQAPNNSTNKSVQNLNCLNNNKTNNNNNHNKRLLKDASNKNLPPLRNIISSDNLKDLKEISARKFQNKNEKIKEFNAKLKQNDQIRVNQFDKPPSGLIQTGIVIQAKKKLEKLEKSSTANIIISKSTSTSSTIRNKNNIIPDINDKTNLIKDQHKPIQSQHKHQTFSLDEKFSNQTNLNSNLIKNNSQLVIKQTIESNTKLIQKNKLCTNKSNDRLNNNNNNNDLNNKKILHSKVVASNNNKLLHINNIKKQKIINNCSQQNNCIYGRYYPNGQNNKNDNRFSFQNNLTDMKSVEIKKVDNNKLTHLPSKSNIKQNEFQPGLKLESIQTPKPLFKPPNTEELMKPTIRGAPSGLLNRLGSTQEILNNEPKEFTVYNFQPREAKKILTVEKPIKSSNVNKLNSKKISNFKKPLEENDINNPIVEKINPKNKTEQQEDLLNTSIDPKSPDLEDFKIQSEKAFFNDNHFSFKNRTSKLIIREKQLKSPKFVKNEEPVLSAVNLSFDSFSSSSTFRIIEKNNDNNQTSKHKSNNGEDNKIKKVINSNCNQPISVELDLSLCYINNKNNNKNSANDNKSKNVQPTKLEFNINFDPNNPIDIEKNLKNNYEAFNKNTFEEMITQPEKFSLSDYENFITTRIDNTKKESNEVIKKILRDQKLIAREIVYDFNRKPSPTAKEIKIENNIKNKPNNPSEKKSIPIFQPSSKHVEESKDNLSKNFEDRYEPYGFYDQNENFMKPKQNPDRTVSVVGSILDVPLPSDNDAFSEYSTFVNNIFNKALEK